MHAKTLFWAIINEKTSEKRTHSINIMLRSEGETSDGASAASF